MIRYLREQLKLPEHIKELPCDKVVNRECNLYRPDLPYDCGTHIVIIECDEEQHKGYNWEACASNRSLKHAEEKRMYEIMLSYECKPVIFIRWNPDSYKVNGVVNKKFNQAKRLDILKKWIDYCCQIELSQLKGLVQYKQLFYDNYDEANVDFKVIKEEECI